MELGQERAELGRGPLMGGGRALCGLEPKILERSSAIGSKLRYRIFHPKIPTPLVSLIVSLVGTNALGEHTCADGRSEHGRRD